MRRQQHGWPGPSRACSYCSSDQIREIATLDGRGSLRRAPRPNKLSSAAADVHLAHRWHPRDWVPGRCGSDSARHLCARRSASSSIPCLLLLPWGTSQMNRAPRGGPWLFCTWPAELLLSPILESSPRLPIARRRWQRSGGGLLRVRLGARSRTQQSPGSLSSPFRCTHRCPSMRRGWAVESSAVYVAREVERVPGRAP